MSKPFTLIFYIIPQDKDDQETPNAFGISKPIEQVTLADIKQNFPLNGNYIFRARYQASHNIVWLDLPTESTPIPQFNNRIFIKATRLSWTSEQKENSEKQITKAPIAKNSSNNDLIEF